MRVVLTLPTLIPPPTPWVPFLAVGVELGGMPGPHPMRKVFSLSNHRLSTKASPTTAVHTTNMATTKPTLRSVLAAVTPEQALAVYNALAQWVDNERNGLPEEDEPHDEEETRARQNMTRVQEVVDGLDAVIAAHVR